MHPACHPSTRLPLPRHPRPLSITPGTLLFVLLFFLFPTVVAYYLLASAGRLAVLSLQAALLCCRHVLEVTPFLPLALRLVSPSALGPVRLRFRPLRAETATATAAAAAAATAAAAAAAAATTSSARLSPRGSPLVSRVARRLQATDARHAEPVAAPAADSGLQLHSVGLSGLSALSNLGVHSGGLADGAAQQHSESGTGGGGGGGGGGDGGGESSGGGGGGDGSGGDGGGGGGGGSGASGQCPPRPRHPTHQRSVSDGAAAIGERARRAAAARGCGSKVFFELQGEPASLLPFFAPHRRTAAALCAHYTPAYLLRCLFSGSEVSPAPGVAHPAGFHAQPRAPQITSETVEPSFRECCELLRAVLFPLMTRWADCPCDSQLRSRSACERAASFC